MKYLLGLCLVVALIIALPVPSQAQVVFFWDINFNGRQIEFDQDVANLKNYGANDKFSSMWVDAGWRVTWYKHIYYDGPSYWVDGPACVWNYKCCGWNDLISSIRVERLPNVEWVRGSGRPAYQDGDGRPICEDCPPPEPPESGGRYR
jgi:hypothetical protein